MVSLSNPLSYFSSAKKEDKQKLVVGTKDNSSDRVAKNTPKEEKSKDTKTKKSYWGCVFNGGNLQSLSIGAITVGAEQLINYYLIQPFCVEIVAGSCNDNTTLPFTRYCDDSGHMACQRWVEESANYWSFLSAGYFFGLTLMHTCNEYKKIKKHNEEVEKEQQQIQSAEPAFQSAELSAQTV